ncbi:MAG: chromophore lyase CpcT/CpeT [Microcoleaceae cyanobacterium]
MTLTPELITLARYLAGEFDNQEQAKADPVWYVHLRLWHRPVPIPLFSDSITLYAEQASVINLDQPYRPRFLRLSVAPEGASKIEVQYYMPKNIKAFLGAGLRPEILQQVTDDQLEFLPGCKLSVSYSSSPPQDQQFKAFPPEDCRCCFSVDGKQYQVKLGFEVTPEAFFSYDQGIDPTTGRGIWGALLGPFQLIKQQDFSKELPEGDREIGR